MSGRRFSRTFCAVGIAIAIIVVIAMSMVSVVSAEGGREGISDTCAGCPGGPMTICLSDDATSEMQRINPTCAAGTETSECQRPNLHWALERCGADCANAWVQAALGTTIDGCFGANSKLEIGISPKCRACVANAEQISNGHLLSRFGAQLG